MEHPGPARGGHAVVHCKAGRRGRSALHQVPQEAAPPERRAGLLQLLLHAGQPAELATHVCCAPSRATGLSQHCSNGRSLCKASLTPELSCRWLSPTQWAAGTALLQR